MASASSVMPSTPFMGVRISWLIMARNSLLARFADSADVLGHAELLFGLARARWPVARARGWSGQVPAARDSAAAVLSATRSSSVALSSCNCWKPSAFSKAAPAMVAMKFASRSSSRAEQRPHLVVRHVEAGGGAAADENRHAQSRALLGGGVALRRPRRAVFVSGHGVARFQGPPHDDRIAETALCIAGDRHEAVFAVLLLDLQHQAMFAAEQALGRAADLFVGHRRTKGPTRSYGRPPARSGSGRPAKAWSAGHVRPSDSAASSGMAMAESSACARAICSSAAACPKVRRNWPSVNSVWRMFVLGALPLGHGHALARSSRKARRGRPRRASIRPYSRRAWGRSFCSQRAVRRARRAALAARRNSACRWLDGIGRLLLGLAADGAWPAKRGWARRRRSSIPRAGDGQRLLESGPPPCSCRSRAISRTPSASRTCVVPWASRRLHSRALLTNSSGTWPRGGEGPKIEANARRLLVSELHTRLVHAAGLAEGVAMLAQAVEGRRHLVAGHVHFPVVAGPLQQPHGLARFLHAGREPRGGVQQNAVEVQRLPFSPQDR